MRVHVAHTGTKSHALFNVGSLKPRPHNRNPGKLLVSDPDRDDPSGSPAHHSLPPGDRVQAGLRLSVGAEGPAGTQK